MVRNEQLKELRQAMRQTEDKRLIEGLWKWLKDSVIHNVYFSNVLQIKRAVRQFICCQNENKQGVIDRLCVNSKFQHI